MFIAIDKITAVRMHGLIEKHWRDHVRRLEGELSSAAGGEERLNPEGQLDWMTETKIAVVVSEEQGEVAEFRNWGLDIEPHRRLVKEGFETAAGERSNNPLSASAGRSRSGRRCFGVGHSSTRTESQPRHRAVHIPCRTLARLSTYPQVDSPPSPSAATYAIFLLHCQGGSIPDRHSGSLPDRRGHRRVPGCDTRRGHGGSRSVPGPLRREGGVKARLEFSLSPAEPVVERTSGDGCELCP